MNLEEKIKKIQEIYAEIENPSIGLEDSVKLYEKASKLLKECEEDIKNCSGKIKEITKELSLIDFNLDSF